MLALWLPTLLLTTLALAQSMEPLTACTEQSTSSSCILTFTPWMTRDVGTKSTYYEAIVTQYFNIIDCKWCSVVNVEDNPTPTGSFSERVTSPVLMVTRVACMPETTAVTRRDIRGYAEDGVIEARAIEDAVEHTVPKQEVRQATDTGPAGPVASVDPAPPSWTMIQAINELRKQIYSAYFAVVFILSGFDQDFMCNSLNQTSVQLSLSQQNLYPQQIKDLVCFSAQIGIQFNANIYQILDQLSSTTTALLLAVQNDVSENSLTIQLCQELALDRSLFTMLKINHASIYKIVCSGVGQGNQTIVSSSVSTVSASAGSSTGAVTFTSIGSNGSVVVTGTGVDISWSTFGGTGGVTATLTGSSWSFVPGNATATAGFSIGTAASTATFISGTAISTSWSAANATASVTTVVSHGTAASTATFGNGTAISASWSGTNATISGVGTVVSSASAGGFSASFGVNGTAVAGGTGSGASGNGSITSATSAVAGSSSAAWSFGASGNASLGITATAGASATITGNAPTPSLSWTTFTNANGSVIIFGTAAATIVSGSAEATQSSLSWGFGNSSGTVMSGSGVAGTAVGPGATATITSGAGNATTVYSYSGMAWTSWIVSSQATVAAITGTAGSIDWGTAEATALINGGGRAITFTIYQITKTIIVTATAIGQTWSVSGPGSAGAITATGISGTWTLEPQTSFSFNASISGTGIASTWINASATSITGSRTSSLPASVNATATAGGMTSIVGTGVSTVGSNATASGVPSITKPLPPGSVNASISTTSVGTGIPFVPANLTSTISVFSPSGVSSSSSSTTGSVVTSWLGNSTTDINATTVVGSGAFNFSTTVAGTISWSSLASVGTGVVTVTNPVNGSNVTLSLTSPIVATPKSFSYPGWTTSTTLAEVLRQP